MGSTPQKEAIPHKIHKAWEKNEKDLKNEKRVKNRSFLLGYKMAINEIAGWFEQEK